jgi:hypothetical protein
MKKLTIYQVICWTLAILLLMTWGFLLWDKNESYERIQVNQSQSISFEADSVKRFFDDLTVRLDSVMDKNQEYQEKLRIVTPRDTIGATAAQKQILRLIDSTNMVKDSINKVLDYMNDSIPLKSLSDREFETYVNTLNTLSNIKIKMDLTIDQVRLAMLKADTDQLAATINRVSRQTEKLGKLARRLESLTKIIKQAINVFSAAISKGIIIPRAGVQ